MYDEDEGGQFLQPYSGPRPDGFFSEIVRRQESYGGYGAPNAPFRTAAHSRATCPAGMPRR